MITIKPMTCAAILLGLVASASAGTWYIPIGEQSPGGFTHIQIEMLYPYRLDTPGISAFTGPALGAEQWVQTYSGPDHDILTADGPNTGEDTLNFAIWIAGDRQVDRPAFHFQAYNGSVLVDNADFYCYGPGETDWSVTSGTWTSTLAIPPMLPGDANLDGKVSFSDYLSLEVHFGGKNAMWSQGDFNGDGKVSFSDYLLLEQNFGKHIPEPASLSLLLVGLAWLVRRRPA